MLRPAAFALCLLASTAQAQPHRWHVEELPDHHRDLIGVLLPIGEDEDSLHYVDVTYRCAAAWREDDRVLGLLFDADSPLRWNDATVRTVAGEDLERVPSDRWNHVELRDTLVLFDLPGDLPGDLPRGLDVTVPTPDGEPLTFHLLSLPLCWDRTRAALEAWVHAIDAVPPTVSAIQPYLGPTYEAFTECPPDLQALVVLEETRREGGARLPAFLIQHALRHNPMVRNCGWSDLGPEAIRRAWRTQGGDPLPPE